MEDTVETVGRLALGAARHSITRVQQHAHNERYYDQMHEIHDSFHDTFMGLIPWIKRMVRLVIVATLLLVSSAIFYGIFYVIVMPGHHITEHLYFDYTCRDTGPPVCTSTENDDMSRVGTETATTADMQLCSPVANVDLFARQSSWQSHHPDVVPKPLSKQQILKSWQHYLIEVSLVMPESQVNMDSGMFAVSVDLQSSNKTMLATSIRSLRIPHESSWIGFVRKSICLIPLLLGALTESKTVVVEPFRHYVESSDYPLRFVTVELQSRGKACWQDSTPVEVISGQVRIGKELNWLQVILRDYFYSCYAMGTMTIFVVQAILWTVLTKYMETQRERLQREMEEWEQEARHNMDADPHVNWEEVPGDDEDQWDDLPTDWGESDRPVTPDHPGEEDEQPAEESQSREAASGNTPAATEDSRADRVMRGEAEPFEVFTDHDDPDLVS